MSSKTEVIDRLRAEQVKDEKLWRSEGLRDGAAWAKNDAAPKHLKRLKAWWESIGAMVDDWTSDSAEDGIRQREIYNAAYQGEGDHDEFWNATCKDTDELREGSYFRGFVEGALKVWDSVKDQI